MIMSEGYQNENLPRKSKEKKQISFLDDGVESHEDSVRKSQSNNINIDPIPISTPSIIASVGSIGSMLTRNLQLEEKRQPGEATSCLGGLLSPDTASPSHSIPSSVRPRYVSPVTYQMFRLTILPI
jgi:hypothetical protein